MRAVAVILLALWASGCASNGQGYREITYYEPDAQGYSGVQSDTKVKNRTMVPPFGGKATSDHRFDVTVNEDGSYVLGMGSQGNLEGGELASSLTALAGALEALAKVLAEVKSPVPLEPLLNPD